MLGLHFVQKHTYHCVYIFQTIDYWHPLEKAQYPKYFATREIRKMEHILWWHEKYGADPEQKTIEEMMDDVAEQRKVAKEAEERKAIDK